MCHSRLRLFIPRLLVLALITVLFPPARAAEEPDEAAQRGWRIYLEARQAAGFTTSGEAVVRDYTAQLRTRTQTPSGEVQLDSKVYFVHPEFFRQEIQAPRGEIVMVYDGTNAWRVRAAGAEPLPPVMVEQFASDLARAHVLFAQSPEPAAVSFLGQEEVEGRPAEVIEIRDVGGSPLRLFVDADTREVRKVTYRGLTPEGPAEVEEFYSDFAEVGGFRWAQHSRVLRNGKLSKQIWKTILKVNSGLQKKDLIPQTASAP